MKKEMRTGKAINLADQRVRVLGLLQSEMTRKLKCSQTLISFVESGETNPPDLKLWSKIYKVSIKEFIRLHQLQCQLPLWKFARKEDKSDSNQILKMA